MINHYENLVIMPDKDKIDYIKYHDLDVMININSEEMYISFPNESHAKVINFDNRMPNSIASTDYLNSLGISAIFS